MRLAIQRAGAQNWRRVSDEPAPYRYDVFLCGRLLYDWTWADDEAGEVELVIQDAGGRPISYADGSVVTARLRGPVEIRLRDSGTLPNPDGFFTPERRDRFWNALAKIGQVTGESEALELVTLIAEELARNPKLGALSQYGILRGLRALAP